MDVKDQRASSAPPAPVIPALHDGAIDYSDVGVDPGAVVVVSVGPWLDFASGDQVEVLWGKEMTSVAAVVYSKEQQATAQVPVLARRIVELGEGVHPVVARVTAGKNIEVVSPAVDVLVKFKVPGGVHPTPGNPYENAALTPAAINPPELPQDLSSVSVVLAPYENMSEGDRIAVRWGKALIGRTTIESSEVGQETSVHIPEETIRSEGGGSVAVAYQIHDIAGNWSCWSRPVTITVPLDDPGAPQSPWVIGTVDDLGVELVPPSEGSDGVTVRIENHPGVPGSFVVAHWEGVTSAGKSIHYAAPAVTVGRPGQTIDVVVPRIHVDALAGSSAEVSYEISLPVGDWLRSQRRKIAVRGVVRPLPPPRVVESVEDLIDPAAANHGLHVSVSAWPGFSTDDACDLEWVGTKKDGHLTHYRAQLSGEDVGVDDVLVFTVPADEVDRLAGGSVRIRYAITMRAPALHRSEVRSEPVARQHSPWVGFHVLEASAPLSIDSTPVALSALLIRLDKPVTVPTEGSFLTRVATGGTPPYRYTASNAAVDIDEATGRIVSARIGSAVVTVTDAKGATATYPVEVSNVYHLVDMGGATTFGFTGNAARGRGARVPSLSEWDAMRAAYGGSPEIDPAPAWTADGAGGNQHYVIYPTTGAREARRSSGIGRMDHERNIWIPIGKPLPSARSWCITALTA
ncbi:hypothetical protein KPL74_06835 [Bacillus sp. NP157]|nr:hypothetical protein KPL74_06835 [Bacillus sp. NP157]